MHNVEIKRQSLLAELKQDLLMNGWDNGRPGTLLRIVLLEWSFQTLLLYRLQVRLNKIPLIGTFLRRILSWLTSVLTSCEINSLAHLEGGIALPHPKGVVIGKGVMIRKGVTIYQHVTIGTRSGHGQEERYPIIDTGAKIFAGAVIAGGVNIGEQAVIGANAVVLQDIPASATAVGAPARVLERKAV